MSYDPAADMNRRLNRADRTFAEEGATARYLDDVDDIFDLADRYPETAPLARAAGYPA